MTNVKENTLYKPAHVCRPFKKSEEEKKNNTWKMVNASQYISACATSEAFKQSLFYLMCMVFCCRCSLILCSLAPWVVYMANEYDLILLCVIHYIITSFNARFFFKCCNVQVFCFTLHIVDKYIFARHFLFHTLSFSIGQCTEDVNYNRVKQWCWSVMRIQ